MRLIRGLFRFAAALLVVALAVLAGLRVAASLRETVPQ
jgi:hypothetical protein